MSAPAAAQSRVEWADVAKGACIALVVLFHATNFLLTRGYGAEGWVVFNQFLEPVRMPLFFLVAGLFAGKALSRSWKFVLRSRVALLAYLYVLWLVLRYMYFVLVPGASLTREESSPWNMVIGLVVPHNGLWFVYALALYFVGAKLLQRWDMRLQLTAVFLLAVVGRSLEELPWTWQNMLGYFMFFLLGLHAKPLLAGIARRTSIPAIVGAVAAYCGATYLAMRLDAGEYALTAIVLSLLGLVVGILAAARLRWRLAVRALSKLGTLTLPVYLMHEIAMGTVSYGWLTLGLLPDFHVVQMFGPVVVALIGIAGALVLYHLLQLGGMSWLFRLPKPLQFTEPAPSQPFVRAGRSGQSLRPLQEPRVSGQQD